MKLIILLISIFLTICHAQEETKFEYGAGLMGISLNHYRGSDQSKLYTIPYPYFSYKSKRVQAEPSYIHGIIYSNNLFSLRLSLLAGLKVDSKDNIARAGMPNLGYTLEAGPMFFSTLWKSDDCRYRLDLGIPVRQVFATDFSSYFNRLGTFMIPFLNFIVMPHKNTLNLRHEFSVASMFGSKGYHRYYYQVAPQYVTAGRQAYDPSGGYTGFNLLWLMQKKFKHLSFVPFIRYDNISGAVYEDSPLVKSKSYWIVALMTNYLI